MFGVFIEYGLSKFIIHPRLVVELLDNITEIIHITGEQLNYPRIIRTVLAYRFKGVRHMTNDFFQLFLAFILGDARLNVKAQSRRATVF